MHEERELVSVNDQLIISINQTYILNTANNLSVNENLPPAPEKSSSENLQIRKNKLLVCGWVGGGGVQNVHDAMRFPTCCCFCRVRTVYRVDFRGCPCVSKKANAPARRRAPAAPPRRYTSPRSDFLPKFCQNFGKCCSFSAVSAPIFATKYASATVLVASL